MLDMADKGQCRSTLPKDQWQTDISKDRIRTDWSWLFAYEAIRKNWLFDVGNVMDDPFFAVMKNYDVSFYDPRRNIRRSEKFKQEKWIIRKSQNKEVMEFLSEVRKEDWHWFEMGTDY